MTEATPNVAELRRNLQDLISESKALRKDVHTAEQARRRATQVSMGVTVLVVILILMLLGLGWQNNQTARQVKETNARMADCTTPGGRCYEEGRARTAQAIQDVLRVSIYMAECARLYPGEAGPDYDRKLEACVYARLAAPSPAPSSR